jgi:Ring finger domain
MDEGEETMIARESQQDKKPLRASASGPAVRSDVANEGEQRRQQEEAESIELARALMAEEAMASYEQHFMFFRDDFMSEEDRAVWQAAMREEEREEAANVLGDNHDADGEISYETMLELGERIGDVKTERWTMVAKKEIEKLPTFTYDAASTTNETAIRKDASENKCLVCQSEYENGEMCCRLPCGHVFHRDGCIDQWLLTRDFCPYCRQQITKDGNPGDSF